MKLCPKRKSHREELQAELDEARRLHAASVATKAKADAYLALAEKDRASAKSDSRYHRVQVILWFILIFGRLFLLMFGI